MVADKAARILAAMRRNPGNVRFADLMWLCCTYFGEPRRAGGGTSHYVFKMPWPGDPRINLQDAGGKAKAYQVRQVLKAINKLGERS